MKEAVTRQETGWRTRIERHLDAYATAYYLTLCTAAVCIFWLPRLPLGFWHDETGTFWMVRDGAWAAIQKCARWPGQSIAYGVLTSAFYTDGPTKEIMLRLPSVLGGLASAYLLYRIAESMIGRGAGFLAAVPFVCAQRTIYHSAEARPYSLALAACLASVWALDRWVRTGKRVHLVAYVLFSALVIYLQYLFGFILVIHAVYVLTRRMAGHYVNWRTFAFAVAAIGFLSLPLLGHVMLLVRSADTLSYAPNPTFKGLLVLSVPLRPVFGAAIAFWVALLVFGWRQLDLRLPDFGLLIFFSFWAIAGPVAFFAVSRATTHEIFVTRYLYFATPAAFLLMAVVLHRLSDRRARLLAAVAVFVAALFLVRTGKAPYDWKESFYAVERLTAPEDPVFVRSPLVESTYLDWKTGPRRDSYLYAPLAAYPIRNPVIPLPFALTEDVKQFVTGQLKGPLAGRRRLAMLGEGEITDWMQSYLGQFGYRATVCPINNLSVTVFERAGKPQQ